jgi:hypothetical protein
MSLPLSRTMFAPFYAWPISTMPVRCLDCVDPWTERSRQDAESDIVRVSGQPDLQRVASYEVQSGSDVSSDGPSSSCGTSHIPTHNLCNMEPPGSYPTSELKWDISWYHPKPNPKPNPFGSVDGCCDDSGSATGVARLLRNN